MILQVEGPAFSQTDITLTLELLRDNFVCSHIRPQYLWNKHTSIGLLIILNNRQPRASNGESAAVKGVHELGLVLPFRAVTDVRPPRLERLEIRAGRNLAEQLLPRQPDFKVVSFR